MRQIRWTVAVIVVLAIGCSRAPRGDGCRKDSDCQEGLRCLSNSGNSAICTTTCNLDAGPSCPQGWKCVELDYWTKTSGCVRE